jgi:hypothetical protein
VSGKITITTYLDHGQHRYLVGYDRMESGMSIVLAECKEQNFAVVIADALKALPEKELKRLDPQRPVQVRSPDRILTDRGVSS